MDPAIAALIGAGTGMTGTVLAALVSPVMTSRRADRARRRDLMREAYAQGLQSIADLGRSTSMEGLRAAGAAVLSAQIQVRLLGSHRAAHAFNELASFVQWYFVLLPTQQAPRLRFDVHAQQEFLGQVLSEENLMRIGTLTSGFLDAARADLGLETGSLPMPEYWLR